MNNPKTIISAILEKTENGEKKIFFQTRWKPTVSPAYTGLLEIPAGGIDGYEDVYETVRREVEEETGLHVVKFINDFQSQITENRPHDRTKVFIPFLCQEVLETIDGLPWIGFVFRCEVSGEVKMNESEAKDPCWLSIGEIKELLIKHPEKIFPLQYPVLEYYVSHVF
jgi:ADP-ribose pyrophosphatase